MVNEAENFIITTSGEKKERKQTKKNLCAVWQATLTSKHSKYFSSYFLRIQKWNVRNLIPTTLERKIVFTFSYLDLMHTHTSYSRKMKEKGKKHLREK